MSRTSTAGLNYSIESLEGRRLLAVAGTLDTSFSGDGKTIVDFGLKLSIPHFIEATDVAVQSDGKTVVAGSFLRTTNSGQVDFAVVRFNIDGTLDQTFGSSTDHKGIVFVHVGKKDSRDFADAIAVQGDGKILVGGQATISRTLAFDTDDFAVIRLMPDGSLDKSFDGDGEKVIQLHDSSAVADIAIQGDGKIVMVGDSDVTGTFGDFDLDYAVVRLTPNGSLDNSFDGDGKKTFGLGGLDRAHAVAFDSNKNIVIVGESGPLTGDNFSLARLKSNGSFDTTFDGDGKMVFPLTGLPNAQGTNLLVQSDNKIIALGMSGANIGTLEMLRFMPDGQLDKTFGSNGTGQVENPGLNSTFDFIRSADGGLIVGGRVGTKFGLAGYTADGVLKSSFGVGGKVVTDFGDGGGGVHALAKGPGRRFVAIGGSPLHAARYLDSGANVVAVGAIDPDATEGTADNGALIVARVERLAVPTRVFFNISGTAKPFGPVGSFFNTDYGLVGMNFPGFNATDFRPYVDIPAGQTFVIVPLTTRDDTAIEGIETAIFSVAPDPSYEIGTPAVGQIDIADNDVGVTTSLKGISDAYVRDGTSANTNFGSATDLQVKTDGSGSNRISYIKFDISSVSAIASAKIDLFGKLADTQNTSVGVSVFSVADNSWTGPTITFNNKPAFGATALSSVAVTGTTAKLYSFDVTNYVKQEKALGHNIISFALNAPVSAASVVSFSSGNASSNTPKLEIVSPGFSAGTFTVPSLPAQVKVGQEVKIAVTWTVPTGGWRGLEWIKLLLRDVDNAGSFATIKFEEARNKFYLLDTAGVSSAPIALVLKDCTFKAAGPTAPTVTLVYAFKFTSAAAGHRFAVDVSARNDERVRSGFSPTGSIFVKPS